MHGKAARKASLTSPTNCLCGKPPVYYRRYEGVYYCSACFCSSIEQKVKKTIGKYRLVEYGDRIVVGLSGGKDSSVALALLHKFFGDREDITIAAATIDEGIAGYRATTLEQAKQLCKNLGIELHIYSFQEHLGNTLDGKLGDTKKDACTFCGVGRRTLLNKAAREFKATKLCVGHNLDDEAQSAVMNFLRGDLLRAGRMGVMTRDEGFVSRMKPLRFIPEKEVALYAILKKLPFSDDECPNIGGMRPEVREFLNDMENKRPGTKFSLLESYDKMVPGIKAAVEYKDPLGSCTKCGEPTSQKVCKTCELWSA